MQAKPRFWEKIMIIIVLSTTGCSTRARPIIPTAVPTLLPEAHVVIGDAPSHAIPLPTTITPMPTLTEMPHVGGIGPSAVASTATITTQPITQQASDKPTIISFEMVPHHVMPEDQTVTLIWNTNADRVEINYTTQGGSLGLPAPITLEASSGSYTFDGIDVDWVQSFLLMAINRNGETSANVQVHCRPEAWFFPTSSETCPATAVITTNMAVQSFERGLMIWTQHNNTIYILSQGQGWYQVPNRWSEGMPEDSSIGVEPPANLYKPVRGFGLAWNDVDVTSQTFRDMLGWATAPETAQTGYYQCASQYYASCYLSGPNGSVVELKTMGSGWVSVISAP